jgi:fibronectin-binding autotransporter adhesin
VLSVADLKNGGIASTIGASTNAAANLVVNGGTLRYTGSGSSTDRQFTLGTTGIIDASGTGALVFSNSSGSMGFTSTTARTLTLTGTSDAALINTMSLLIANTTPTRPH